MARSCHALAAAKHATVDEYIDALPTPLRSVAEAARHMIDAALEDADSAIRWAHPTWSLDQRPVCYLKAASKHVTFGFWHGASIDDRSGRLESSRACRSMSEPRSRSVSNATTSPRTPPTLTTRPCGTSTSTPPIERRQGRSSSVPGLSSS